MSVYPGSWNNSKLCYEFPVLRKTITRGSKQCVIYWQIIVELYDGQNKKIKSPPPREKDYAILYTIFGDEGGVEKISEPTYVYEGKQKRNLFEQALNQANSIYKKQEKKYLPQALYKPMLSQTYSQSRIKLNKDKWYLQVKIDGVRALFHNGILYSRELNIFPGKKYILDSLQNMNIPLDFVLDGELYKHGMPLQEINSNARTSHDTVKLCYNIFDGFSLSKPKLSFEERWSVVKSLIKENSNIKLVDTYRINTIPEIEEYLEKYLDDEYEGVILRNNSTPYESGKRSYGLLKYKKYLTEEFAIIDVRSGIGKYTDYPIFVLSADLKDRKTYWSQKEWEDCSQRTFDALYACGNIEEGKKLYRELILDNKKLFYKKYYLTPATVKFFSYTKENIPRHAHVISLLAIIN